MAVRAAATEADFRLIPAARKRLDLRLMLLAEEVAAGLALNAVVEPGCRRHTSDLGRAPSRSISAALLTRGESGRESRLTRPLNAVVEPWCRRTPPPTWRRAVPRRSSESKVVDEIRAAVMRLGEEE